jgi:hypothetical protein
VEEDEVEDAEGAASGVASTGHGWMARLTECPTTVTYAGSRRELALFVPPGIGVSLLTGDYGVLEVAAPDGQTRRTSISRESRFAGLANTWNEPKTFHVKATDKDGMPSSIEVSCAPLVDAPKPSGLADHAFCKTGHPCVLTSGSDVVSGACSALPQLGDDFQIGTCSR